MERRDDLILRDDTDSHALAFMDAVAAIASTIDHRKIGQMVDVCELVRHREGRLFVLGLGGGAANASHAVNDFRKLCRISAVAPTDNIAEFSARMNDEGRDSVFTGFLKQCMLGPRDGLLVFSVGGGSIEHDVSVSIAKAVEFARERRALICGVVGRKTGVTAQQGDVVIVVPEIKAEWTTPLTEAFQMVVLHCLVSHPSLQRNPTKW